MRRSWNSSSDRNHHRCTARSAAPRTRARSADGHGFAIVLPLCALSPVHEMRLCHLCAGGRQMVAGRVAATSSARCRAAWVAALRSDDNSWQARHGFVTAAGASGFARGRDRRDETGGHRLGERRTGGSFEEGLRLGEAASSSGCWASGRCIPAGETPEPASKRLHPWLRSIHAIRRIGPGAVVVRKAIERAGVTSARTGAHVFRHTLGTEMLRHGASLDEIGRVLRHRYSDTTAIYAKDDLPTLRKLAMRWPGWWVGLGRWWYGVRGPWPWPWRWESRWYWR